MRQLLTVILLISLLNTGLYLEAADNNISFENFPVLEAKLPSKRVKSLFKDSDGYMWIATESGLFRYDGYKLNSYKSCLTTPELLTSNNITSITEDNHHKLWIGTRDGLNILDKRRGEIIKSQNSFFDNNLIDRIVITKAGSVYIASGRGFCQYFIDSDSCHIYKRTKERRNGPPGVIKGLYEDSDGLIWMGSWQDGMSCFNPQTGAFKSYSKIGTKDSPHTIYEDSKKRLWVGTWGDGVAMLENKHQSDPSKWRWFRHDPSDKNTILENIIYSIIEDSYTGDIWIGSRGGLSVIDLENDKISNYYPSENSIQPAVNEVNSIVRNDEDMWLGLLGGGVCRAYNRVQNFHKETFELCQQNLPTHQVNSITTDDNGLVYVGLFNKGLVIYNPKSNTFVHRVKKAAVGSFYHSKASAKLWILTLNEGMYVQDLITKEIEHLYISEPVVCGCVEDSSGNLWVATRYYLLKYDSQEGKYIKIPFVGNKQNELTSITIDKQNRIWCSTSNRGIFRVNEPKRAEHSSLSFYNKENGKILANNIKTITIDSRGRVWCGSEGYGLMLYDEASESFISVNEVINLPFDHIMSITEDGQNNLWIGTNSGLIKLTPNINIEDSDFTVFTTSDGLNDNIFTSAAYFDKRSGIMYMGNHKGYIWFHPETISHKIDCKKPIITDILISGVPWQNLSEPLKSRVSSTTPEFAQSIELPYSSRNLTIEFASLDFGNKTSSKYLYKLEGVDKQWISTEQDNYSASYNNLSSGSYKFRVKVVNHSTKEATGSDERQLMIDVLTPQWLSWWAISIYLLAIIVIFYFTYRIVRNRIRLINRIRLNELEKQQIQNLNQTKIQFYTDVTHEFLTPLTVITASIDELKQSLPENESRYNVMSNNANKLIRLFQQILEFRKSDTGNLKLKVSKGDIIEFIKNSCENILPLMKQKELSFSFESNVESAQGWFDTDKLDKIIYNLLSNAFKYSDPKGTVRLVVTVSSDGARIRIDVRDNGQGMTEEQTDLIFDRFNDGNYRKHKTYGFGIGLSLTKALTELHGGVISVESNVGEGSVFSVDIPMAYDDFNISEIDTSSLPQPDMTAESESDIGQQDKQTILLVEDDPEILELTRRILNHSYNVITAIDGEQAIESVNSQKIDIIVSDVMMPKVDGLELTKWLKSNIDYCHIPIVLLTARTAEKDRIESYDSGADGYITKPFNRNVLLAKIRNLLRARQHTAKSFQKQFVFEAKELDFTSMDEAFVSKAANCVHENLSNPDFEQMQLVEQMAVSRSTLYRKITSLTGMNPSAFIRNVRLKEACMIMKSSPNVRIAELAYAVGFNDPKYFSSCFKKEFGILPTDYIEQLSKSD